MDDCNQLIDYNTTRCTKTTLTSQFDVHAFGQKDVVALYVPVHNA